MTELEPSLELRGETSSPRVAAILMRGASAFLGAEHRQKNSHLLALANYDLDRGDETGVSDRRNGRRAK
jgi:hypothetical protein